MGKENNLRWHIMENLIEFPDEYKLEVWIGQGDQQYSKDVYMKIDEFHLNEYIDKYTEWEDEILNYNELGSKDERIDLIKELTNHVNYLIKEYMTDDDVINYYYDKYEEY